MLCKGLDLESVYRAFWGYKQSVYALHFTVQLLMEILLV